MGYFAIRDLIPLYAVYSLLFADHGLTIGEISSLLVIWSVTAVVTEVPAGALADAVSRRGLLVLSSLSYAAGFSLWTALPSYAGFATGFVLWGISGSLMSGTFEAFLYDELADHDATSSYARVMGWANSLAMVADLCGAQLAAPLFAIGGYQLVGWVSVCMALLQGCSRCRCRRRRSWRRPTRPGSRAYLRLGAASPGATPRCCARVCTRSPGSARCATSC